MDNSLSSQPVQAEEHVAYHVLRKRIKALGLPRAPQKVLLALAEKRSGTTLHTRNHPLTIEKIAEEACYKRSHTIATLRELEDAGYIQRIRNKIRLPDGTLRNLPTTYVLTIPEIDTPAKSIEPRQPRPRTTTHAPSYAPEPVAAASVAPPPQLPVKANVEPVRHPEMVAPPESPDDFDDEAIEMGDAIVQEARAQLEPHVNGKQHRAIAVAWQGVVSHRYTLGQAAIDAGNKYLVQDETILACVAEWVRKAVLGNPCASPVQSAARLRNFFNAKGKAIAGMRKELKW